jgi:hypothetical protein
VAAVWLLAAVVWVIGALAWIDTAYSDIALYSNSNVASFEDQDTN